VGLTA